MAPLRRRPIQPGSRRVQHLGLPPRPRGSATRGGRKAGGRPSSRYHAGGRQPRSRPGRSLFVGSVAAALLRSGYTLSGRRLVILGVVAAGVWATHGAAVTWSLRVVALGLLLLGAVERPTPEARG